MGIPPVVTEGPAPNGECPHSGTLSNAHGSFIASNCNPVPQAGKWYNGPDLDYVPLDLSVPHMFSANATVQLPWKFEVSPTFRVQSGFVYSRQSTNPPDVPLLVGRPRHRLHLSQRTDAG